MLRSVHGAKRLQEIAKFGSPNAAGTGETSLVRSVQSELWFDMGAELGYIVVRACCAGECVAEKLVTLSRKTRHPNRREMKQRLRRSGLHPHPGPGCGFDNPEAFDFDGDPGICDQGDHTTPSDIREKDRSGSRPGASLIDQKK